MAEAIPPGRAGRAWLVAHIATADHSVDLLRQKQQLLAHQYRRLTQLREQTADEWRSAVADADLWSARVDALGGTAGSELLASPTQGRASVTVSWRNTMGVLHPDEAHVDTPDLSPMARARNAAVGPCATAHQRALQAAAREAVVEGALRALQAELASTRRRLRAIERHRLPWLEGALHALTLRLDEVEREERLVTRCAAQRLEEGGS